MNPNAFQSINPALLANSFSTANPGQKQSYGNGMPSNPQQNGGFNPEMFQLQTNQSSMNPQQLMNGGAPGAGGMGGGMGGGGGTSMTPQMLMQMQYQRQMTMQQQQQAQQLNAQGQQQQMMPGQNGMNGAMSGQAPFANGQQQQLQGQQLGQPNSMGGHHMGGSQMMGGGQQQHPGQGQPQGPRFNEAQVAQLSKISGLSVQIIQQMSPQEQAQLVQQQQQQLMATRQRMNPAAGMQSAAGMGMGGMGGMGGGGQMGGMGGQMGSAIGGMTMGNMQAYQQAIQQQQQAQQQQLGQQHPQSFGAQQQLGQPQGFNPQQLHGQQLAGQMAQMGQQQVQSPSVEMRPPSRTSHGPRSASAQGMPNGAGVGLGVGMQGMQQNMGMGGQMNMANMGMGGMGGMGGMNMGGMGNMGNMGMGGMGGMSVPNMSGMPNMAAMSNMSMQNMQNMAAMGGMSGMPPPSSIPRPPTVRPGTASGHNSAGPGPASAGSPGGPPATPVHPQRPPSVMGTPSRMGTPAAESISAGMGIQRPPTSMQSRPGTAQSISAASVHGAGIQRPQSRHASVGASVHSTPRMGSMGPQGAPMTPSTPAQHQQPQGMFMTPQQQQAHQAQQQALAMGMQPQRPLQPQHSGGAPGQMMPGGMSRQPSAGAGSPVVPQGPMGGMQGFGGMQGMGAMGGMGGMGMNMGLGDMNGFNPAAQAMGHQQPQQQQMPQQPQQPQQPPQQQIQVPPATPKMGGPMHGLGTPISAGGSQMGGLGMGLGMGMSPMADGGPGAPGSSPFGMPHGAQAGHPGMHGSPMVPQTPTADAMGMGGGTQMIPQGPQGMQPPHAHPLSRQPSLARADSVPAPQGVPLVPPTPGQPAPSQAAQVPQGAPADLAAQQRTLLPPGLKLDEHRTRVEAVPAQDADALLPPLAEGEVKDVKAWMAADEAYIALRARAAERARDEILAAQGAQTAAQLAIPGPAGLGVPGFANRAWWDRDAPGAAQKQPLRRGETFGIAYPRKAKEQRDRRKPPRREGLKVPSKMRAEDAEKPEQLVPIRLEFDVDQNKMRDTFVWNLSDPLITPEMFAQTIVDDYALAPSMHAVITKTIQEQLSDYKAHATPPAASESTPSAPPGAGSMKEEDAKWWDAWRRRAHARADAAANESKCSRSRKRRKVEIQEDEENADAETWYGEDEEELRIVIKLDVIVGSMKLDDQIEWDLSNTDTSPEQFAEVYARDLGLSGEFKTAVSHLIREQVQLYQKSLFLAGPLGNIVPDEDFRASFLPTLVHGARAIDQVLSFTPLLNYVSDDEIERSEREREKELIRRKKRTARNRRGTTLPDREPLRTYRTPAIGFPAYDPANFTQKEAIAQPTSRRAAAQAAQLNIANMVAAENGDRPIHTPVPQSAPVVAPTLPKEAKAKGLFKPPSLPPTVLRPRAAINAPIPSTALEGSSFTLPDADVEVEAVAEASVRPPASRADTGPINATRARQLEREAKEKEYVEGQHSNWIDGEWHCSNCGCPASIAVGRRKGPLGDKTQCGPCGKFWHRHRRPRPIEYHSELSYHENVRDEAIRVKTAAARKKRAQPIQESASTSTPAPTSSPSKQTYTDGPPRAVSPASSESSAEDAPLATRLRTNGGTSRGESSAPPGLADAISSPSTQRPPLSANGHSALSTPTPPEWLRNALAEIMKQYPHDHIDLSPKRQNGSDETVWRIKCLDCPGKLYSTGPGESLTNYEVHLKNRKHRQTVNARISESA